jgi:hypothetical protein
VDDGGRSAERWISLATTVVAPITVVSALLFYFGYASSRAMYEFFGVDVDTVGLGTQDYIMRSPQPLLVPLIGLLILGVMGLWLHVAVLDQLGDDGRRARVGAGARVAVVGGGALLTTGVVLVVLYPAVRGWAAYGLVVPLCLATGIVLLVYGRHMTALAAPDAREPSDPSRRPLRRLATVLAVGVVAASVFWATATLAQWSGRGQALELADRLHELPSVILDTKERLYVHNPVIEESVLPLGEAQTFRYRYRQLRLLVHGGERVFLVPAEWSTSGTTILVPLDDSIRMQFQFENPS